MSTEAIFGSWDELPTRGIHDNHARLWHVLAAQKDAPNFGLSQRRHEITMLWDLYRRAQPRLVVEIGTAQGGTAAAWCQFGRDDAEIILIDRDLNDCRPRPGEPVNKVFYEGSLRTTEMGGGAHCLKRTSQTLHCINGWSHEPKVMAELLLLLGGRKIDFLFNDASHSREMFATDFALYWPLIADGGVFAAHDIMPSKAPQCDKSLEWERILAEETYSAVFEFKSSRDSDSMGIGALIK